MEALLAIVQLLLVPVLLVVALATRFAGTSKPLNIVDYSRVSDAPALHRWAGNRLLVLPLGFCISGAISLLEPTVSLPMFVIMTLAILGVGIWIALGAERFQSAA
ncbi:hypothetical protein [Lysobacter sp. A03]|uniref:hypothetical protein n=1 Tax=Lysobacter sp. A03 TaxID=1199154 RepID=UPI00126A008D|nr:hypothetical protein [Lysobacter sp. A03]